jgi:hypothetical protein
VFSSGVGIENLTLDTTADTGNGNYGITMCSATENGWWYNVRTINRPDSSSSAHKHFWMYGCNYMTVQNSYLYGGSGTSESYGVDFGDMTNNSLVLNTICQHQEACVLGEGSAGNVAAYNFQKDNYYNNGDPQWQQAETYHHTEGDHLWLFEGNQGDGMSADNIHGSSWMFTAFRNYYTGHDLYGGSSGGKTEQTIPIMLMSLNRYYNLIGNVLGTVGYHTTYESYPTASTGTAGVGNTSTAYNQSIYVLGWSGAGGTLYDSTMHNDIQTRPTSMRWGNWDVVNNAVRFVSAEVPSGLTNYPNPVPASQTLPASFLFNSRPNWFVTTFGTPPWPPIGPEVTGGNIANTGGHANNIPAALVAANTPADMTYAADASGLRPLQFDGSVYGTGSGTPPPLPPTNVTATVR